MALPVGLFFIDLCVVYVFLHDYLTHFRMYNPTSTEIVLPTHTSPKCFVERDCAQRIFIFLPFRPRH